MTRHFKVIVVEKDEKLTPLVIHESFFFSRKKTMVCNIHTYFSLSLLQTQWDKRQSQTHKQDKGTSNAILTRDCEGDRLSVGNSTERSLTEWSKDVPSEEAEIEAISYLRLLFHWYILSQNLSIQLSVLCNPKGVARQ